MSYYRPEKCLLQPVDERWKLIVWTACVSVHCSERRRPRSTQNNWSVVIRWWQQRPAGRSRENPDA